MRLKSLAVTQRALVFVWLCIGIAPTPASAGGGIATRSVCLRDLKSCCFTHFNTISLYNKYSALHLKLNFMPPTIRMAKRKTFGTCSPAVASFSYTRTFTWRETHSKIKRSKIASTFKILKVSVNEWPFYLFTDYILVYSRLCFFLFVVNVTFSFLFVVLRVSKYDFNIDVTYYQQSLPNVRSSNPWKTSDVLNPHYVPIRPT